MVVGAWFLEGTREQQQARLEELRLDPQFQKPWSEGDIPVRLQGGELFVISMSESTGRVGVRNSSL
jgi:hypothetical protein